MNKITKFKNSHNKKKIKMVFSKNLENEENLMKFNPSLDLFEKSIFLKQGFYNYKYILKKNDILKKNLISGSHYRTENSYQIFVYHKSPGSNFFSLIGFDNLNSFNINNSNLSQ